MPRRKSIITQKKLYSLVSDWYDKHVEDKDAFMAIRNSIPRKVYHDSGAFDTLFDSLYNNYDVSKAEIRKVVAIMTNQINNYKEKASEKKTGRTKV